MILSCQMKCAASTESTSFHSRFGFFVFDHVCVKKRHKHGLGSMHGIKQNTCTKEVGEKRVGVGDADLIILITMQQQKRGLPRRKTWLLPKRASPLLTKGFFTPPSTKADRLICWDFVVFTNHILCCNLFRKTIRPVFVSLGAFVETENIG